MSFSWTPFLDCPLYFPLNFTTHNRSSPDPLLAFLFSPLIYPQDTKTLNLLTWPFLVPSIFQQTFGLRSLTVCFFFFFFYSRNSFFSPVDTVLFPLSSFFDQLFCCVSNLCSWQLFTSLSFFSLVHTLWALIMPARSHVPTLFSDFFFRHKLHNAPPVFLTPPFSLPWLDTHVNKPLMPWTYFVAVYRFFLFQSIYVTLFLPSLLFTPFAMEKLASQTLQNFGKVALFPQSPFPNHTSFSCVVLYFFLFDLLFQEGDSS